MEQLITPKKSKLHSRSELDKIKELHEERLRLEEHGINPVEDQKKVKIPFSLKLKRETDAFVIKKCIALGLSRTEYHQRLVERDQAKSFKAAPAGETIKEEASNETSRDFTIIARLIPVTKQYCDSQMKIMNEIGQLSNDLYQKYLTDQNTQAIVGAVLNVAQARSSQELDIKVLPKSK